MGQVLWEVPRVGFPTNYGVFEAVPVAGEAGAREAVGAPV